MHETQSGSQHEIPLLTGFDRKSEQSPVCERGWDLRKPPRQVSQVDEDVGGGRNIEFPSLHPQKFDQLTADQSVVDLALPRARDHIRRDVDPGKRAGERTEARSEKTGAATQ